MIPSDIEARWDVFPLGEACRMRGLGSGGSKPDMIARLLGHERSCKGSCVKAETLCDSLHLIAPVRDPCLPTV